MATPEEFSAAIARTREAVENHKRIVEMAARNTVKHYGSECIWCAMDAILTRYCSPAPAMTKEVARHLIKCGLLDHTPEPALTDLLLWIDEQAALRERIAQADRVAELEDEVARLEAQICALKFELEMGGHQWA